MVLMVVLPEGLVGGIKDLYENEAIENNPILTLANVQEFRWCSSCQGYQSLALSAEVFGLIGPNGAGKTTLINLITGVNKVDQGTIKLNGEDITNRPNYYRARWDNPHVSAPHLLQRCDIETNLFLGIDLANKRMLPGTSKTGNIWICFWIGLD